MNPSNYVVLSALLFSIGAIGVLVRRNPLVLFMCIELMLNAVNLSFVALGRRLADCLIERARAGVDVWVLYDDVGSQWLPLAYRRRLRDAGIRAN